MMTLRERKTLTLGKVSGAIASLVECPLCASECQWISPLGNSVSTEVVLGAHVCISCGHVIVVLQPGHTPEEILNPEALSPRPDSISYSMRESPSGKVGMKYRCSGWGEQRPHNVDNPLMQSDVNPDVKLCPSCLQAHDRSTDGIKDVLDNLV